MTKHEKILNPERTALLVVDVQEKLMPHIEGGGDVIRACRRLVEGFKLLGLPVFVTEQYPKGLGPSVPELREVIGDSPVYEKRFFSAFGNHEFQEASVEMNQLLVCGVETHVCVNQTVHDALVEGHQVHVAADAVGSRSALNRQVGLDRMRAEGGIITSVEMALFELMHTSEHPQFRAISKLIK